MARLSPPSRPILRRATRLALAISVLALAGGIAVVRWQARELERKSSWLKNRLADLKRSQRLPNWLEQRIPDCHDHRRLASELLLELGPEAEPALPVLLRIFREGDENEFVQANVNGTLMAIGARLEFLVPELIQNLQDNQPHMQVLCEDLLESIGPKAKAAVPALMEILSQTTVSNILAPVPVGTRERAFRGLQRAATEALGVIGPEAHAAVPLLIQQLGARDTQTTFESCRALRQIGPAATEAIPALSAALNDPNAHIRIAASRALLRIAPQTASNVHPVLKAIEDEAGPLIPGRIGDLLIRREVGVGLWETDRTRPCPVAGLIPVLLKKDGGSLQRAIEKACAAELLGEIGPEAKDAIPALVELFEEDRAGTRRTAAIAIRRIDPESASRLGLPGQLALP